MAPETRRPHTGGPRRRTTAEFIALAGLVHGEETYDYGKVNYQTTHEKVEIVCPEHGRFTQRPSAHLRGAGCPNCGLALRSTSQIYGGDRYVEQARNVHGDRYDYSQLGYHGQRHKITVICKEHGPFSQLPGNHLKGNGCPRCGNVQKGVSGRTEIGEFIDRATAIHGDGRYDYSQVVLTTQVTPVAIICHRHGIFRQRPHKHLQGDGCRACCESRGEREIRRVLKALGWDFVASGVTLNSGTSGPSTSTSWSLPVLWPLNLMGSITGARSCIVRTTQCHLPEHSKPSASATRSRTLGPRPKAGC